MMNPIYLDYNATTLVDPAARQPYPTLTSATLQPHAYGRRP